MDLPLFVYRVQLVLIAECNKKERNLVDFVMTDEFPMENFIPFELFLLLLNTAWTFFFFFLELIHGF